MKKSDKGYTPIELPPPSTARWVKSRKMAVIQAIENGQITEDDACARYNLSVEELHSWKRMIQKHGPDALRTTHLKRYRNIEAGEQSFQLV